MLCPALVPHVRFRFATGRIPCPAASITSSFASTILPGPSKICEPSALPSRRPACIRSEPASIWQCSAITTWSYWPSPTLPQYRLPRPADSASLLTTRIFLLQRKGCRCWPGTAPTPRRCRALQGKRQRRLCAVRFRPRRGAPGRGNGALRVLTRLRHRPRHARNRVLHLPTASSAGTVLEAGLPAPPQRRLACG
jgi:hypothetical protein